MFQSRTEALALVMPAVLFSSLIFLLPVGILLTEGFQGTQGWSLEPYVEFSKAH